MNRILDLIDELQKTPEKLENLIHGKFYLTAVRTLISTLRTLNGGDLCEIGALESIRTKLDDLKNTLPETLLEELHNHIYLKSPFSLDRIDKQVQFDFSKFVGDKEKVSEDLEMNPESDSFLYMGSLLESLYILGRLPDAMEIVRERLPVEIYYVVERTIQEVDRRTPLSSDSAEEKHLFDLIGSNTKAEQASLLRDLLFNLFVKLEAIIDAHKFIASFAGIKAVNVEICSDKDVWSTVQNEVKALLYDYLTNSNRSSAFNNSLVSMNEILKEKRGKVKSKPKKQIFRITGSSLPDGLEKEYREILSATTAASNYFTPMNENSSLGGLSIGIIDKYANVVAAGHRLLVKPDPYNVLLAFKPTIVFSEKIEASIGVKSGNFKIFLEDFMLNVFLPQMEERVLGYFHNFVNVHQTEFVKMIEMVLVKYYEKCLNRFRALMFGDHSGQEYEGVGVISAGWACEDEIVKLLLQNTFFLNGTPDLDVNHSLSQKETYIEMKLKRERSFHRNELIFEIRKLKALAHMHYSLENYSKWSTDSLPTLPIDTEDDVQLPLSQDMESRFDSILNYYQELSETYIFTLRVELRCHSMFYLDLAMREGNYFLEDEPSEPDSYVSLLNEDLINVEESSFGALPTRRIRFLFDGLSFLITYTLCANLRYIKQINRFGVMKLLRNVQSIQHCLTNIAAIHEKGLDRARDYFSLLDLTPDELMKCAKSNEGKFTYDEYLVVLDLIFQPILSEDAPGARKQYQQYLEKLKALFVNKK
ncbi:hypothetical protein HDU97_010108 [Phlyctochytrium planicorne]|nr:hypothetical protein HDU97_010108 [Phlyctochytrium planicorne]